MKFNFESWQEFLDWNVKRENHIAELREEAKDRELERMKAERNTDDLKSAIEDFMKEVDNYYSHCSAKNTSIDAYELEQHTRAFSKSYFKLKNATAENSDE